MKTMSLNGSSAGTGAQRRRGIYSRGIRCLFVLLGCLALLLPVACLGEEAKETILTRGPFEYVLRPGGGAEIVGYSGAEERLTIPKTLDGHPVTAIRDFAYSASAADDWRLAAVTIPAQVTDVGANPFADCMALAQISVPANHPTLMVSDGALYDRRTDTLIAYPAAAADVNVTVAPGTKAIGDSAFSGCGGLVSADLPEGIISIGDRAFLACASLTDVSLPDSLTEIGDHAFANCTSLTEAALPGGLTALGQEAFSGCSSLASVTIPDSLTDLPSNPFTDCTALTHIGLSAAHPTLCLEDGVLYDRPAARLVWYPSGRTDASFTVPAWVREIGAYAFSSRSLASVTLSEGVAEIGTDAFSRCRALTSVDLPGSLRSIGDSAFFFCGLSDVDLPEGLARIGRQAFGYCRMTALKLPEGLTEIGEEAFSSCTSLTEVSFPSTLERIGRNAFYYCTSLTAVSLPEGVTGIDDEAFSWCGSLKTVSLPVSLAFVGQDAFHHCGEGLVFIVPRSGYAEEFCLRYGYAYAYADAPSDLVKTDAPWVLMHPELQEPFIGRDRMNLYVYWVQVRLKATGRWYQGDEWDCTGNLGSHTMTEISAFMRSNARMDHDGTVDDTVIGLLADVQGVPEVLVGGFYDRLNILTGGDRYGDMTRVDRSSPRDAVKWVQICLKGLGYYNSAIDGKFGSGTLRALHAFQKKYGWLERDHVSYGVARDLLERYVAAGGDPDELPSSD